MTDARVTQATDAVAVSASDPNTEVTSVSALLGLVGNPEALTSSLTAAVVAGSTAPNVQVSSVTVQVLVSWRVKQDFQAIWVE